MIRMDDSHQSSSSETEPSTSDPEPKSIVSHSASQRVFKPVLLLLTCPLQDNLSPQLLRPRLSSQNWLSFTRLEQSEFCPSSVNGWIYEPVTAWKEDEQFTVTLSKPSPMRATQVLFYETRLVAYPHHSYQFLFNVGNKLKLHKVQELLFSALQLVCNTYYQETFPELLEQFFTCYPTQGIKDVPDERVVEFFRQFDLLLDRYRSSDFIFYFLVLTGLLNVAHMPEDLRMRFTPLVLSTAKSQLTEMLAVNPNFQPLAIRGLGHQLVLDLTKGGNEWRSVLVSSTHLELIFQELASRVDFLAESIAVFCADQAQSFTSTTYTSILSVMITNAVSHKTVFQLLKRIPDVEQFRLKQTEFVSALNRTKTTCFELSDIELVLDLFEDNRPLLIDVLQASEVKYSVKVFLQDQDRMSRCHMNLFKRLVKCRNLLNSEEKSGLIKSLILKFRFPISTVLQELVSTTAKCEELWREWLKSHPMLSVQQLIECVDQQLHALETHPELSFFAEVSVQQVQIVAREHNFHFLKLSKNFQSANSAKFRDFYVLYWKKMLPTLDNKSQISMNSLYFARCYLLNQLNFHGENHTLIIDLTKCTLEASPNLEESYIREQLFTNPKEKSWLLILQFFSLFSSISFAVQLQRTIATLGEEILKRTPSIEDFTQYSTLTLEQQDFFNSLITAGLANNAGNKAAKFVAALKDAIAEKDDIIDTFNLIDDLLNALIGTFPELQNAVITFSAFKLESAKKSLAHFHLLQEYKQYKELGQSLQPFFHSEVYKSYLIDAKEAYRLTSQANAIEPICKRALQETTQDLNALFLLLNTSTVNRVTHIFQRVLEQSSNIEREISILATPFSFARKELVIVKECLCCYQKKGLLVEHCTLLTQLAALHLFADAAVLQECKSFCTAMETWEQLLVPVFLKLNKDIVSLICSQPHSEIGLSLLGQLYRNKELLVFLEEITDPVLVNLKENVNDYDDLEVTTQVIEDLETVWEFREGMKLANAKYIDFLTNLTTMISNPRFQGLMDKVESCQDQLNGISWLRREVEDKETAKMKQIEAIYQAAELIFVQESTEFDINLKFSLMSAVSISSAQKRNFRVLNESDLQELKERAVLTLSHSREKPGDRDVLETFISFAGLIQRVLAYLTDLESLGYPLNLADKKTFFSERGNCQKLSALEEDLRIVTSAWTHCLNVAYSTYPILTFFFGKQFWILDSYLMDGEEGKRNEAVHLLKFAWLSNVPVQFNSESLSPEARLDRLGRFLTTIAQVKTAVPKVSYEVPEGAHILLEPGSILIIDTASSVRTLLSVYLHSKGKFPMPQEVMLCRKETLWGEVLAFITRCFMSTEEELFTLVDCEFLRSELLYKLEDLLITYTKEMKGGNRYQLAIITRENCPLATLSTSTGNFKVIRIREKQLITNDNKAIFDLLTQLDDKMTLVTSESAGMGKSTWIRNQAKSKARELVSLSLSGDLHPEEICEQLLFTMDESKVLHVQLNLTDDPEFVNKFLCSMNMFRTFVSGNLRVFYPFSYIFIEVANVQPSLEQGVVHLAYLRRHEVTFSIAELTVTPTMHYVCSYLQHLTQGTLDQQEVSTFQFDDEEVIGLLSIFSEVSNSGDDRTPGSYRRLCTFVQVMSTLLIHFEKGLFSVPILAEMTEELVHLKLRQMAQDLFANVRSSIMNCLLDTSREVTTVSMSKVHHLAISEVPEHSYPPVKSYESGNHFALIFLEDGSFIPIYRNITDVPDYLKKLISIQQLLEKKSQGLSWQKQQLISINRNKVELKDYMQLTHDELLRKILECFSQFPDPESEEAMREYVKETQRSADFVMTPDNFLKMHLMYLRAMAKLPVVIMGETGCGKTYLIRYFVRVILKSRLLIFNIHAGVTTHTLDTMVTLAVSQATETNGMFWVFFDEFNTTLCIGQICELLCDRRYRNQPVPENMIFVAACNPFRLKPPAFDDADIGCAKRRGSKSLLVHMVNPLPENALEFVWDFGTLSRNDMRRYVLTMLDCLDSLEIREMFTDMICMAHDYFIEKEDWSSASLRDVARFRKLYKWFSQSVNERMELTPNEQMHKFYSLKMPLNAPINTDVFAAVLAFCYCYYLRISRQSDRDEFLHRTELRTQGYLSSSLMMDYLTIDQMDLISRMDIPAETALNLAFKENVSTLVHCLFNKVPLFICGKPGCSKSLAIQLVFQNCRGRKSKNAYFQSLPELIPVPFQGSNSCTSEGILLAFSRAEKYFQTEKQSLLPVVVFDEIALAEASKQNPLKVLHSLLEGEDVKVGFVGVSNWRLDASKMNRALYLARPDPSREELVITAISLHRSMCGADDQFLELISALAKSYGQFMTLSADIGRFYGLRDFYHLIKQVSEQLQKCMLHTREAVAKIVFQAVSRNFGGRNQSVEKFMKLVTVNYPLLSTCVSLSQKLSVAELIRASLQDKRSRHLMLISKGDSAAFVLERHLRECTNPRVVLVGSELRDDYATEDCNFRALSEIILYMEKGISIVMKDMQHIYSALYNLFNQSFSYSQKRRYCRVALGSRFNPRCRVHEDFHAIVFLSDDDDVLSQTDTPFLNRFEKQQVDLEEILTKEQLLTVSKLDQWLADLKTLPQGKTVLVHFNYLFPLSSIDYLKLLSYTHSDVTVCKRELIKTAPGDILVLADISVLSSDEKEFLSQTWKTVHSTRFLDFLEQSCVAGTKHVVFTPSNESLKSDLLNDRQVHLSNFSSFSSQIDFIHDLERFSRSSAVVYLLDFAFEKHSKQLIWLRFTIEKTIREFASEKCICLLVRIVRNTELVPDVWWFDDHWELSSFDTLQVDSEPMEELLAISTLSLILKGKFGHLLSSLPQFTAEVYERIRFEPGQTIQDPESITKHVRDVIEEIPKSPALVQSIEDKVVSLLQNQRQSISDWKELIFSSPQHIYPFKDLASAINSVLFSEVMKAYTAVIHAIEKETAFHSYFSDSPDVELLHQIWISAFSNLACNENLLTLPQSNVLHFKRTLHFPYIRQDWKLLKSLILEYSTSGPHNVLQSVEEEFIANTVMKDYYSQVNENPSLQGLYFRDLVRLSAEEYVLSPAFEDLLVLLHDVFARKESSFVRKILNFLNHKKLALLICEVAQVCEQLGNEEIISEFSYDLKHFEHIDEPSESSDFFTLTDSCIKFVSELVQSKAFMLQPCTKTLRAAGSLQRCAELLDKLFMHLRTMANVHDLEFDKLEILDFWTKLLQLALKAQVQESAITSLAEQGTFVMNPNFVYDSDFIKAVKTLLLKLDQPALQQSFQMRYYSILLNKCPDNIQHIAHDITSSAEFVPCPDIIEKVMELCELDSADMMMKALMEDHWVVSEDRQSAVMYLEQELGAAHLSGQFVVMVSDSLLKKFELRRETGERYVATYIREFQSAVQRDEKKGCKYPNISQLLILACIRTFLDHYCTVFLEDAKGSIETTMVTVDQCITQSPLFPTLRLYCQKVMNLQGKQTYSELKSMLQSRAHTQWTQDIDWTLNQDSSVPLFPLLTERYQKTFLKTPVNLSLSNVNLKNSPDCDLAIALGLYVNSEANQDSVCAQWVESHFFELEEHLGAPMCSLMRLFSTHSIAAFLLKDTSLPVPEQQQRTRVVSLVLLVLLANRTQGSPFTSLFFNMEGDFWPNIEEQFNRNYVYGVESRQLDAYMLDFFKNFQHNRPPQPLKTDPSVAKCQSCEFLYFIEGTRKSFCPYCKAKLVEGFSAFRDDQALEFLRKRLLTHRDSEPPGYLVHKIAKQRDLPIRDITMVITFRLLHLFLNVSLCFLKLSGAVSDQRLLNILQFLHTDVDLESYFREAIHADFEVLKAEIRIKDISQWIESVLVDLPAFLSEHKSNLCTRRQRDEFEQAFEREIVKPKIEHSDDVVKKYKQSCQFSGGSWVSLLEEISSEIETPMQHLFRSRQKPTFEQMESFFALQHLGTRYRFLNLYIRNKLDFMKIKCLPSLLSLTNYFLDKFNHMISRTEAKQVNIRDILDADKTAKELFSQATEDWNCWLAHEELTYQGRILSARSFSELDSLSFFLLDTREEVGLYMVAALSELAATQNKLLKLAFPQSDLGTCHAQHTPAVHILTVDVEDSSTFDKYYANNTQYGKGLEVYYDFESLDHNISERLSKARLLDFTHLDCIQYSFEMLCGEDADFLTSISKAVPQQQLSPEAKQDVERFFRDLMHEGRGEQHQLLRSIYSTLSLLLCQMKNFKLAPGMTIAQLASKTPSSNCITTSLSNFKETHIEHIIDLFETIETNYFPVAKELIPPELRSKELIGREDVEQLRKLSECHKVPELSIISAALMKFIMRCVLGQGNGNQSVGMYISRADFWPPHVLLEQKNNVKAHFGRIRVAECLQYYETLQLIMKTQAIKPVHVPQGPQSRPTNSTSTPKRKKYI